MPSPKLGRLKNGNTPAPISRALEAPRCGARCKRTGAPCRAPAMQNGRCRLHGGLSTGPRTQEGIRRIKEANTVHGFYAGPGGVMGEDAGHRWPGHKNITLEELKKACRALGWKQYKRGYTLTKIPPILPRDARGRFRKPYSNDELWAFAPIDRDT